MTINESIYIDEGWNLCAQYLTGMKADVFFTHNSSDMQFEISKENAEEIIAFLEKHFKLGAKQ